MPPLPSNGISYPPSSSGYAPLPRTSLDCSNDDPESSFPSTSSSSRTRRRTYGSSPSNSIANSPTDLLRCFLADTRTETPKKLGLRITFTPLQGGNSRARVVELELPELSDAESIPFGVADDVPALRGLSKYGPRSFTTRLGGLCSELVGTPSSDTSKKQDQLQIWSTTQGRAHFASSDDVERSRQRFRAGTCPPWAPLDPSSCSISAGPSEATQEEPDLSDQGISDLLSGGGSDLDLGVFFRRSRKRTATRLVSIALQEALERFADERAFSKQLRCREAVWGWDLVRLQEQIKSLTETGGQSGKGKERAEEVDVGIEVTGLKTGPVYEVVWTPIAALGDRIGGFVERRTALLVTLAAPTVVLGSVLLGMLENALFIFIGIAVVGGWTWMFYLLRTRNGCVHDTIGTAWTLAPHWVKVISANASWDEAKVTEHLKAHGLARKEAKLQKREGEGWYYRRGLDQDEWLDLHRARILHALRTSPSSDTSV